uniref:hypothetical protein n=1 Tax=Candidatus Electronema sp. TaxID=2698783 RepID=UPI004055D949
MLPADGWLYLWQDVFVKVINAIATYMLQVGSLWGIVEASTYFKGDALKIFLGDFWIIIYIVPLVTTSYFFIPDSSDKEKNIVVPYSEGRNAWKHGNISFLYQTWFSLFLIFFIVLSSFLWYATPLFNNKGHIFYLIAVSVFIFIISITYARYRIVRSLEIKHLLHRFAHEIRDEHSNLLERIYERKAYNFLDWYLSHLKSLVKWTQEYFRKITKDNTIEVAIRIAFPSESEQGNVVYKTVARTDGLDKNRESTSEPIAANEGLPKYLIENNRRKILIYNDINKAIEKGVFKKTRSEEEFPNEIVTMMVAPLNGYDGKRKSMIGILYVTSRKKNVFREDHVDCMKFVADKISDTVSISIEMGKLFNKPTRKKNVQVIQSK